MKISSIVKIILVLVFCLACFSSALYAEGQVPPFKPELDAEEGDPDPLYNPSNLEYTCPVSEINCFKGGWHFEFLNMPEVWNKIDLFGEYQTEGPITDFTVGIIDSGFSRASNSTTHEGLDYSVITDLVNGTEGYGNGAHTTHGNMVLGTISGGMVGGELSTRPMIRAKTALLSTKIRPGITQSFGSSFSEMVQSMVAAPSQSPAIINISVGMPTEKGIVDEVTTFDLDEHYEVSRELRSIIEANPTILFVYPAGNLAGPGRDNGGILHRVKNANGVLVIDKLPNLLVVAANTADGHISRHSAFGHDVDMAAPTNFLGIGCANAAVSGMRRANISTAFGSSDPMEYKSVYGNDSDIPRYNIVRPYVDMVRDAGNAIITPAQLDNTKISGEKRCENNGYPNTGNSASAALVSGAAAILKHAANELGEDLSASELKEILLDSERAASFRTLRSSLIGSATGLGFDDPQSGNRIIRMGSISNPVILPLLDVNHSLDKVLDLFEPVIDPDPSLSYYFEDGYTLVVGGQKDNVYRKLDDQIPNFDGEIGIYIEPNTTACLFVDGYTGVDILYLDNNDQSVEIARLSGECEVTTIPETSWQQTSQRIITNSSGISIRVSGTGSGILIPYINMFNYLPGEAASIVFDNQ